VLVAVASASAVAADGSAQVLRHGPPVEKVVALTFDDGWGRSAKERILRTLIAEKVPATFFPYALAVGSDPAFWKRVAQAGFPIGNHSYSHPRMTRLTRHEMEWQISASRRLVESITGVPMLRVFRPPYGRYDRRVLAAAASQGFDTVLLWDATAGDSGGGPSYRSVFRGATAGKSGSVVLLHTGRSVTAEALPAIIRFYRSGGFRFVTVPELLGATAVPWPAPSPTPTPWPTLGPTPTPSGPRDVGTTPVPEPTGGPGPTSTPPIASPAPSPIAGPPVPPALLLPAVPGPASPVRRAPGHSPRTWIVAS
jgi:peptidoglycan/xylan/chitin deacetylase (PgdA/CDA1 family)